MKKYAFGVDVGGTTCKIGLFETSGELIEKWEIKTNTKNNGAAILPDVAAYEETIRALGGVDLQLLGLCDPGQRESGCEEGDPRGRRVDIELRLCF